MANSGQFKPGNPGGKKGVAGRKPKADELKLAELLDQAWPEAERVAVLQKLAEMAVGGDKEAAKILLSYAYGRPRERHEFSGPAGEAVKFIVGVSESDL